MHSEASAQGGGGHANVFHVTKFTTFVWTYKFINYIGILEFVGGLHKVVSHY